MNLGLFNNILNNVKENTFIQNFMKELSNYLEKSNSLKQEDCLYQVVEMGTNYAYLQNINSKQVSKKDDIPKEILNKIGNDTVLRYKDGKYIIDEELTQKFFDNLVEVKEYEAIQNNFINESNILDIDPNTIYEMKEKGDNYCVLSYGKDTIKVPNQLVPFWTEIGENLCYKNGEFKTV